MLRSIKNESSENFVCSTLQERHERARVCAEGYLRGGAVSGARGSAGWRDVTYFVNVSLSTY